MFEDINQHRAAVAENIQKAIEIGFTGGELEKAHKVGDIHPNGKWVWTQLPSGKFDWRVRKQASTGSGGSSSAAVPDKKSAADKTWDKISDFSKMNSVEAQLVAQWGNFVRRKDTSYMSTMRQLLQQKFPNVAQWKQTAPNTGVSKITAVDVDGNEIAVLDLSGGVNIPKLQTFMDKCSEVKKESKQQTVKMPATLEEAEKMGVVDVEKVNSFKVSQTLYGCKRDLEEWRGKSGRIGGYAGRIDSAGWELKRAVNMKIGDRYDEAKTEEEKLKKIQDAANKLATCKAIIKKISARQSELNKAKKKFLDDAGNDFTEAQIEEYLQKFETSDEAPAVVHNTWKYAMGRIGSTSATIQVGKSKEKPFNIYGWDRTTPSWRPIGIVKYSIPSYRAWGNHDVEVKVPVQSWEDVNNALSGTTESFTIYLYKHPKQ